MLGSRFFRIEAASGVLLLIAALVALVWASSPWSAVYEALRHQLHFVIDDVLMAVFFFLAGLEIKRELHDGSLSTVRRALLPVAAAFGGMAAPAIAYLAFHHGTPAARGWGIPIATDIAFAVGVLSMLGRRIPRQVRILLLALAVVDDLGAIVVIAVFYSSAVSVEGLGLVGIGVGAVLVLRDVVPGRPGIFLLPGALAWYGALVAGVSPTIAGVVLGLLVPATIDARSAQRPAHVSSLATRLEARLHPWVAYGIMPLFALANAGVDLRRVSVGGGSLDSPGSTSTRVLLAIAVALVVGKPVGITLGTWVGVRLGGELPPEVTWRAVLVVGAAGGIGFTMSIFVAGLAFGTGDLLGPAKLGVLVASLVSGLAASTLGMVLLRGEPELRRGSRGTS
jgi:NhaA family Na+:H+ antiporter